MVDKTPDWRPDTYADTKRGKQARQELGGTRTMEQKPFFTQQPEEQDESVFVQPQHRNTGHASVRLGGPEDGKVTMLGSGAGPKAPTPKAHPQPVGGLARAGAGKRGTTAAKPEPLPSRPEDNDRFERTIIEYMPDPLATPFMTYYSTKQMRQRLREEKDQYTDANDWKMRQELEEEAKGYGAGRAWLDTYRFRNNDRAFASYMTKAKRRIGSTNKK